MPRYFSYRDLRDYLNQLDEQYLDQTVMLRIDDEYHEATLAAAHEEDGVLDFNHLFFGTQAEINQYNFIWDHAYDI